MNVHILSHSSETIIDKYTSLEGSLLFAQFHFPRKSGEITQRKEAELAGGADSTTQKFPENRDFFLV